MLHVRTNRNFRKKDTSMSRYFRKAKQMTISFFEADQNCKQRTKALWFYNNNKPDMYLNNGNAQTAKTTPPPQKTTKKQKTNKTKTKTKQQKLEKLMKVCILTKVIYLSKKKKKKKSSAASGKALVSFVTMVMHLCRNSSGLTGKGLYCSYGHATLPNFILSQWSI